MFGAFSANGLVNHLYEVKGDPQYLRAVYMLFCGGMTGTLAAPAAYGCFYYYAFYGESGTHICTERAKASIVPAS